MTVNLEKAARINAIVASKLAVEMTLNTLDYRVAMLTSKHYPAGILVAVHEDCASTLHPFYTENNELAVSKCAVGDQVDSSEVSFGEACQNYHDDFGGVVRPVTTVELIEMARG